MVGFLIGIQIVMLIMQLLCLVEGIVNKRDLFEVGKGYVFWGAIPVTLMNFII